VLIIGEEWRELLESLPPGAQLRFKAIAWSSLDRLCRAMRYPEHFELDCTASTNILNLPLVFVTGSDADNRSDAWMTAILSNEKRYGIKQRGAHLTLTPLQDLIQVAPADAAPIPRLHP
jgi:hypothetical protein